MGYYKLREERVLALIREKFGEGRGAFVEFANDIGIAATTVSRWFMDGEGRRNIGEEVARRIETKYRLDPGYLVMPEMKLGSKVVSLPHHGEPWPFKSVPFKRYDKLDHDDKVKVEDRVKTAIEEFEANLKKRNRRG